MILLPSSATFWIATQPVDFRRSFDVLVQLAREQTGKDVIAQHRGAVVFFFNRTRDRCKAIFHDRTGVVILYKRLNEGRFYVPSPIPIDGTCVSITVRELTLLLDGLTPLPTPTR